MGAGGNPQMHFLGTSWEGDKEYYYDEGKQMTAHKKRSVNNRGSIECYFQYYKSVY